VHHFKGRLLAFFTNNSLSKTNTLAYLSAVSGAKKRSILHFSNSMLLLGFADDVLDLRDQCYKTFQGRDKLECLLQTPLFNRCWL